MPATRGTQLQGSRATHDVSEPGLHCSDHEANAPTIHNPLPGVAGEVVTSDGAKWTSAAPAGAVDADALHDNVAGEIHAIANKAVPVDADELVIEDSVDGWNKKRIAISTLPGGAGGDVVGPVGAVGDNLVLFNGATGKLIKDAGAGVGAFAVSGHDHAGVYEPAKGLDDNFVTDAEKIIIGNTSGANSGDVTLGAGSDPALALVGQELTLTLPAAGPHDAVTLGVGNDPSLALVGQVLTLTLSQSMTQAKIFIRQLGA